MAETKGGSRKNLWGEIKKLECCLLRNTVGQYKGSFTNYVCKFWTIFNHLPTLITLLRIPYLCHFGSTSFLLPNRPKYSILNWIIRVSLFTLVDIWTTTYLPTNRKYVKIRLINLPNCPKMWITLTRCPTVCTHYIFTIMNHQRIGTF